MADITYTVTPLGATGEPNNYTTLQAVFNDMVANHEGDNCTIKCGPGAIVSAALTPDSLEVPFTGFGTVIIEPLSGAEAMPYPQNDSTVAHTVGTLTLNNDPNTPNLIFQKLTIRRMQFGGATANGFITSYPDITANDKVEFDSNKIVLNSSISSVGQARIIQIQLKMDQKVRIVNNIAYSTVPQTKKVLWFACIDNTYRTDYEVYGNSFDMTNLNHTQSAAIYGSNSVSGQHFFDLKNNLILGDLTSNNTPIVVDAGTVTITADTGNTITATGSAYMTNASTGVLAATIWTQRTASNYTTAAFWTANSTTTTSPLAVDMLGQTRPQYLAGSAVVFGGAINATFNLGVSLVKSGADLTLTFTDLYAASFQYKIGAGSWVTGATSPVTLTGRGTTSTFVTVQSLDVDGNVIGEGLASNAYTANSGELLALGVL